MAQIARCNRDVRCDSNRRAQIASDVKTFFASDAKTHSLDLKSQENARKNACENPAMLACDAKNQGVFKIERCEMPAIRTLAAVWPAMRAPARCQIASDVGRAMRTTKILILLRHPSKFVMGEHWTGSLNKSIDQIGKKCPKIVLPAPRDNFWTFFGHFFDIFRTLRAKLTN